MENFNPYLGVIAICIIIIFSYNFNLISKYTSIPSVLLLIGLGVLIKQFLLALNIEAVENINHILEMVGIVGLIMIVLEASVELEIKKEKTTLILKSFFIAFTALLLTSFSVAYVLHTLFIQDFFIAMLYAVPLSIMSSAIIIPSVAGLMKTKREFLIYESAFSDILGIMLFYFLLDNANTASVGEIIFNISVNIISTVILSIVTSYFLVWLLQKIKTQVKMILLISVLVMLYAIAKMLHLSSLIIILIFGLILNNYKIFFKGKMSSWILEDRLLPVLRDFKLITIESAFFVRTFFFVIFGVSLELTDLLNFNGAMTSVAIIAIILVIRFISLKLFGMKYILPELFVAPRGLITILLFFGIPVTYQFTGFNPGILLYTIIISSIIMAIALVAKGKERERYDVLNFENWDAFDKEIKEIGNSKPDV